MANQYLGQQINDTEPSKLQQVMAALGKIGQTGLRASAAMQDPTFFEKEKAQKNKQAMDEKEFGLKSRELDIQEQRNKTDAEIKRLMLAQKTGSNIPTKPGEISLDRNYAKEYNDFINAGGYTSSQDVLVNLNHALKMLNSGEAETGTLPGTVSKIPLLGSMFTPSIKTVQQDVNRAIQGNLKPVLGGQFTEKDRQFFQDNALDVTLSTEENKRRLQNQINYAQKRIDAKIRTAQYWENQGTLKGYKGSQGAGLSELGNNMNKATNKPKTVIQNGIQYTLNEETGQYE